MATGITRIVFKVNNSHGVHRHSFWEIMSWALKRQTTCVEDRAYSLVGLLHANLTIVYGEGHRAFSCLAEAIVVKNPSWDVFTWFGQPSMDHFTLPLSPASYPTFNSRLAEDRVGVQGIAITPYSLSLKSLSPIQMEVDSIIDPKGSRRPFLVSLKPHVDKERSLGQYGNLVGECRATCLRTIHAAWQLSVCILNHHTTPNCEQGKLVVGSD